MPELLTLDARGVGNRRRVMKSKQIRKITRIGNLRDPGEAWLIDLGPHGQPDAIPTHRLVLSESDLRAIAAEFGARASQRRG